MKPIFLLTVLSLALAACGKEEKRVEAPAVAASSPDAAPSAAALPPPPTAVAAEPLASASTGSAAEQRREARAARSMRARGGSDAGAAAAPAASGAVHVVAKGDTLSGIARARGLKASDLARWNGVRDPRQLRIGQKLRLTAP